MHSGVCCRVVVVAVLAGAVFVPSGGLVTARADVPSLTASPTTALAAAAGSGTPVLVRSLTAPDSITYANPDGSFTTTASSGPAREPDPTTPTGWTPIDTHSWSATGPSLGVISDVTYWPVPAGAQARVTAPTASQILGQDSQVLATGVSGFDSVSDVRFDVDGASVGHVAALPFSLDYTPSTTSGTHAITATVTGLVGGISKTVTSPAVSVQFNMYDDGVAPETLTAADLAVLGPGLDPDAPSTAPYPDTSMSDDDLPADGGTFNPASGVPPGTSFRTRVISYARWFACKRPNGASLPVPTGCVRG